MASVPQVVHIRKVWNYNLEPEFALIRQIAMTHQYVSIDTEFPGEVFEYEDTRHPRHFSIHDRYWKVKCNVDRLKLIQLGLTLSTSDRRDGNPIFVWEFNFRGFNPLKDPHSIDSIKFLESQGHDLWKNYHHGVDPQRFASLFWSSGLLCNQSKTWVGFHLAYDAAYLVKLLISTRLPDTVESFLELTRWYFGGKVYDVKQLCKSCKISGGLERVAGAMNVSRAVGLSHHAGSDSFVTMETFRRMKEILFPGGIEPRHNGILFGIQES